MKRISTQDSDLEIVGHESVPPTPDILDALEKDYPFEASVADLVDNSIDARARNVLIRFIKKDSRLKTLCIADDGRGMDAIDIKRAMKFAARRQYAANDLGMFGVGFRKGYGDLVRLYIGRAEPDGKRKTLDLYKAFEMMCRDEEDFRAQLAMYVKGSGITPKDVPALVFNSYPQLRPTSRNKMFNAEITWAGFDYREPTTQAVSKKDCARNIDLFSALFRKHGIQSSNVEVKTGTQSGRFGIHWCRAPHAEVLKLLSDVRWDKGRCGIEAELNYLARERGSLDSWLVIAPQVGHDTGGGVLNINGTAFRCILRSRFETRFNVFSDPDHVSFAKWLVGADDSSVISPSIKPIQRTGVLLVYPTKVMLEPGKAKSGLPTIGFSLTIPSDNVNTQRVAFQVQNKRHPNDVVVNVK